VKDSLVLLRFDSYESISVQPFLRRRLVNESCQIACERAVDDWHVWQSLCVVADPAHLRTTRQLPAMSTHRYRHAHDSRRHQGVNSFTAVYF